MFGYLRVFILVSLISVVLIAVMVGVYLRSISMNDLTALTERTNTLTAESYRHAVWEVAPPPMGFQRNNAASAEQKKALFLKKSRNFLDQIAVQYLVVYNKAGQPIYTYHGEASNIRLISKLIADLPAEENRKISFTDHKALADGSGEAVVLRTFMALDNGEDPSHYVEIHSDISDAYHKIILNQWVASGSIVIVFLLLIVILTQTSKRAEQIIARQHESNMELAKKAAVAEAENEQKSMFLANVSHELRTPLNAIIGFSDIMRQQMPQNDDDSGHGHYVHDIHSAGVHLLSLINDILDFSKAEAGKIDVDIEEVNFSKMVKNCLRLVQPRAEEAGVSLVDASPKDSLILNTDSKKLKQIMLNLLSNSVKFTPEGGEVKVTAWRNIQDDSIGFEVKDSGIGMAPKDIARAMSPFGQVDSKLSRKFEGTGLGLPLTKKFVELMGGSFKIESEEGKGTSVSINIPVQYQGVDNEGRKVA